MAIDESDLVTAAIGGDRAAMEQLLRTHHDRIYAVCRRITGNDADAADASQEALISIVRSLSRFDGRSSFSTWVYRVATNASLDELRRRKRRPTTIDGRSDDAGWSIGERSDHAASDRLDAIAEQLSIDDALLRVPEEFRLPLVLRDVGDLEYSEIAATLDIPVGTVKSRIARGRAVLAQILRAGNHDAFDERPITRS